MRYIWKRRARRGRDVRDCRCEPAAFRRNPRAERDKTIDIAEMTWASAAAIARIHAHILEDGYGCTVEVVSGDTVPTSASMLSKGVPAIAPELWTSSIQEQWQKGLADGKVIGLGDATFEGGGIEGWFIPQYFADEHPELKTAEDVIARPEPVPRSEDSSKGRLYSCPPGWACELANTAMFEAYDMKNKGWDLFSPGSGGNLDASIGRAFLRKEPIFFYYWGPTAILGKYPSYQLELPPADTAAYECNTSPDCEDPPVSDRLGRRARSRSPSQAGSRTKLRPSPITSRAPPWTATR